MIRHPILVLVLLALTACAHAQVSGKSDVPLVDPATCALKAEGNERYVLPLPRAILMFNAASMDYDTPEALTDAPLTDGCADAIDWSRQRLIAIQADAGGMDVSVQRVEVDGQTLIIHLHGAQRCLADGEVPRQLAGFVLRVDRALTNHRIEQTFTPRECAPAPQRAP